MERESKGRSGLNARQKIVVIVADILVLAELTWSIYFASQDPEEMTFIFLKNFIPLVIGTILVAMALVRRLEAK